MNKKYESEEQKKEAERQQWREYKERRKAAGKPIPDYKRKSLYSSALDGIRRRCRKQGLDYDLTEEFLESITPTHCPLLDIPLIRSSTNSPNQPTVDRIVPSKGYVKGNVMIISRRANVIKNDATPEELVNTGQRLMAILSRECIRNE